MTVTVCRRSSMVAVCVATLVFAAPANAGLPVPAPYVGFPGPRSEVAGTINITGGLRQSRSASRIAPIARAFSPFLAFLRGPCAMCLGEQWWIAVRAARHGSLVSDPDLGWPTRVGDLELKANGSVAWTLDRLAVSPNGLPIDNGSGEPPAALAWEVWALDSHGQRVLDSGPNLDLHSLELNGSTLTWIKDGTTRSATLD